MKKILFFLILWLQMHLNVAVAATPIDELLNRIDKGAASKFVIERQAGSEDFFELSQAGNKIRVRGNSWVSIAMGINWYLKYTAHIFLGWNHMHEHLPNVLPPVQRIERHVAKGTHRYYFNYCTFSYSMPFWDWNRWQEEIDWMALHGINMPLAATGEECVWRNMLKKLGYSQQEIKRFIAGPAFLAWWAMNNLEGWGGPLPDSWFTRQQRLQQQILQRERTLGMSPVLPGYCGMLPHDAMERLHLEATPGGTWNGYTRPANLSAEDSHFASIAQMYYNELTRLYGKADYYSFDPFHESADDSTVNYAAAGKSLLSAMKRANNKAVWVVQGWTENPRPQMIDSLPSGDVLILDLFSECRPMFGAPSVWRRPEGYGKHPWVFCMLENFGANVGLHGRMDQLLGNWKLALQNTHLTGTGLTMEGIENNPVMFELMTELPWMDSIPSKQSWVERYADARYGHANDSIHRAWQLLASTIYNCPAGNNQQGPHESIFDGRPSLHNFQVKSWSKMHNYYDPAATLEAARLFASASAEFANNDNYLHDLVDITRQAMDDQARLQYLRMIASYQGFSRKSFSVDSARFIHMLMLQDSLLGTRREFRLGTWIARARAAGTTLAEQQLYEWNARVQITTWGNRKCADEGGLRDYAHKEWQGLLKDFYLPRWQKFLAVLSSELQSDSKPKEAALGVGNNKTAAELFKDALPHEPQIDWYALEAPWTRQHNAYDASPHGNSITMANEVIKFLCKQSQ